MKIDSIHWLGHDSFRIDGNAVVYFDPWNLKGEPPKADVICISHEHFDHFSPPDIARIAKPDTAVFTIPEVAEKISGSVQAMKPGDTGEAHGIKVEAVAAYNQDKDFHPKDKEHLGFILEIEGTRIYHAGDTDFIPEMEKIQVDVALLPVSGTYVMTAEEAARAAAIIKPKVAIPMHYGQIVGTKADAERFKSLYQGETIILDAE